jgi:hypothetical protein
MGGIPPAIMFPTLKWWPRLEQPRLLSLNPLLPWFNLGGQTPGVAPAQSLQKLHLSKFLRQACSFRHHTGSNSPSHRHQLGVSFAADTATPGSLTPSLPVADCWYVVVVGRTPSNTGVYQNYATVAPLVVGVSGTGSSKVVSRPKWKWRHT